MLVNVPRLVTAYFTGKGAHRHPLEPFSIDKTRATKSLAPRLM